VGARSFARVGLLVILASAGAALAACGSDAAPGVASLGSTTTTAPAAGSAAPQPFAGPQKEYQYLLNYAQCMRSKGVSSFPDPTKSARSISFNPDADSKAPGFASANKSCEHLLPDDGGTPTAAQLATETQKLLQYTDCMRAHGIENFPDPIVNAHQIGFSLQGIDPNSPRFKSAQSACKTPFGA
jgi:hypothetical protein